MKKYLLLLNFLSVTFADGAQNITGGENVTFIANDDVLDNTTDVNITKDSKSLFFLFVKPKPNPITHHIHHLLHAIKHPQKPNYNTPCGKPHCPGSPQPTGPSPPRTTPTPDPTALPAIDVNNCTCISPALCRPADTINQGEGVINPRNLCQPGLVCCLTVPFIPIEIERLQWGQGGRGEKKQNAGRYWREEDGNPKKEPQIWGK